LFARAQQETRLFDNKENAISTAAAAFPSLAAASIKSAIAATKIASPGTPQGSPLSPHSPNVVGTPTASSTAAADDAGSPAFFNFRAGSTPGVTSRSRGGVGGTMGGGGIQGTPDSVNNVMFDGLHDIEALGDGASPIGAPPGSSPAATLRAEDSFLTESELELDEEEDEDADHDDDAAAAAAHFDDAALRSAVSAALTTTPTAAASSMRASARTPGSARTPSSVDSRSRRRHVGPTPANTPAAQGGPTPTSVQRNATPPSAVSPLEEDVVEEVRSWFASVHSKLDVALCAISPAAGVRAGGGGVGGVGGGPTPGAFPTPGGSNARHGRRTPIVGATLPPQMSSRFAPTLALTPTPTITPAAAAASSGKKQRMSSLLGGNKTPGAYTPGGAPVTPAALRSQESPGTMMAPGGCIAKLLGGTTPTPSPGAAEAPSPSTPGFNTIWGGKAMPKPPETPAAAEAEAAEEEGGAASEVETAVTTPAMAVNAAARVDSHTPTTPTDDGEYRAEESVGTPSSSLKSPAANDDFSFDLSFSGKPSSDSSDAGDVIDGDALALEAAANASAAMAPAALRATCLLTCTVGMYRLNALDPELESAWFQPLSLSSEKLVSKFGFSNANLYRYSAALLSGDVIAFLSLAVSGLAGAFGSSGAFFSFATATPAPITCVIHSTYFIYPPALAAALRAVEAGAVQAESSFTHSPKAPGFNP
jgi:hypothetical protein